jgi:glycosyltransferase involved in cell wall biosynthesis
MKENPLVSILMNCYNGERYLKESLQSVLNQTYKNWELIFWDNCSTDDSKRIFSLCKDKRMKYFLSDRHTNLGEARRLASQQIKGDLVAILDVDDLWMPDKLEKQINCFEDDQVGISITNTIIFSDKGAKKMYTAGHKSGFVYADMLRNYDISLETVMFRKSLLGEIQFSGAYKHIADYDLIMRILERSKLSYLDNVLAKWRVHQLSCSAISPLINNLEKKMWLSDNFKGANLEKYKSDIAYAFNRIEISESIMNIKGGGNIDYKNLISNLNFKFAISYVFFIMVFIPWGRILIKKLYARRFNK